MDHRYIDPGFAASGVGFIVLRQPPVATQPRKGALHNPSLGQHYEAAHPDGPKDGLQQPAVHRLHPAGDGSAQPGGDVTSCVPRQDRPDSAFEPLRARSPTARPDGRNWFGDQFLSTSDRYGTTPAFAGLFVVVLTTREWPVLGSNQYPQLVEPAGRVDLAGQAWIHGRFRRFGLDQSGLDSPRLDRSC